MSGDEELTEDDYLFGCEEHDGWFDGRREQLDHFEDEHGGDRSLEIIDRY